MTEKHLQSVREAWEDDYKKLGFHRIIDERAEEKHKSNKYTRTVKGASIDVYDVLKAWNVTNPAVQHAIKKLLQPGERGHKDLITDLFEAKDSIERAIQLELEN